MTHSIYEELLYRYIGAQDADATADLLRDLCVQPGRMTPGILSIIASMLSPEASALPLKMTISSRKRGAKPKVARNSNISMVKKIAAKNGDTETRDLVMNALNATGVTDDSFKREVRRQAQEQRENDKRMAELAAEWQAKYGSAKDD